LIWFSETNLFFRFDSAHHWRIAYYRLLCCQMSTLLRHHESLSQLHKDVGCDANITTEQSAVVLNNKISKISCTMLSLCEIQRWSMGLCHGIWSLIRRMQRPNRFADSFCGHSIQPLHSRMAPKRIGESIRIANRNALIFIVVTNGKSAIGIWRQSFWFY